MTYGFFVYGLICPRTNQIIYVGQTTCLERRLKTHKLAIVGGKRLAPYLGELRASGEAENLKMVVLQKCNGFATLGNAEKKWIEKLGKTNKLLNFMHNPQVDRDGKILSIQEYKELLDGILFNSPSLKRA